MSWAAVASMVASAVVQSMAQGDVERKQRSINDALTAYRKGKTGEAIAATDKYMNTITPEARAAENAANVTQQQGEYANTVAGAKAYEPTKDFAGNVSSDYTNWRDAGKQRTADRVSNAVRSLGVMSAPTFNRLAEASRYGTAGAEVSGANSAINNVTPYYQQAMAMVKPDPIYNLLNTGLQAYGISSMMGGGGTPSATGATAGQGLTATTNPALGGTRAGLSLNTYKLPYSF